VGTGLLQYAGHLLTWLVVAAAVHRDRLAGAQRAPAAPARSAAIRSRAADRRRTPRGFRRAFFGAEVFVPLLLVEQRGLATTLAGASLTGGALTWSLGSWYQGRPNRRFSRTQLVTVGLVLVAVGIAITATVLADAMPPFMAAIGWLVAGLGMGIGITSLSVLVLELSPTEEQGAELRGDAGERRAGLDRRDRHRRGDLRRAARCRSGQLRCLPADLRADDAGRRGRCGRFAPRVRT
jgi:hypothetical protein